MHEIEQKLLAYRDQGELERVLVRVPGWGGAGGIAIVGLPEWDKRSIDTFSFINKINREVKSVTDVRAFAIMRKGISGGGNGSPVSFVLQGNTFEELAQWRDILVAEAQKNPNLLNIDSDYQETYPQFSQI